MTEPQTTQELTREVKGQLDGLVVGVELTLISIIQGLALGVLANSAATPMVELKFETWLYIILGLQAILIFWSRSLIHTLSFIGWPLEFGHNFIYFGSTLIEAALLTQVTNPLNWFALSAVYFGCAWFLYWYDLRVVRRHEYDFQLPGERKLYADIIADQTVNVRLWMPLAVGYHLFVWWAITAWPDVLIEQRWHLAFASMSVLIGFYYLWEGVHILRRRQGWIVTRYVQERREAFEPEDFEK